MSETTTFITKAQKRFTFEIQLTADEFKRKALDFLAKKVYTPNDSSDYKLGEVILDYCECIGFCAHVEADFQVQRAQVVLDRHVSEDVSIALGSFTESEIKNYWDYVNIPSENFTVEQLEGEDAELSSETLAALEKRCTTRAKVEDANRAHYDSAHAFEKKSQVLFTEINYYVRPFCTMEYECYGEKYRISAFVDVAEPEFESRELSQGIKCVANSVLEKAPELKRMIKLSTLVQRMFLGVGVACAILAAVFHIKWLIIFPVLLAIPAFILSSRCKKHCTKAVNEYIEKKINMAKATGTLTNREEEEIVKGHKDLLKKVFSSSGEFSIGLAIIILIINLLAIAATL